MSGTTDKIFEKLDTISVDVGVIKATMIDRESLTAAIAKCADARPCVVAPNGSRMSGKAMGAVVAALVAVTAAVVALTQLI